MTLGATNRAQRHPWHLDPTRPSFRTAPGAPERVQPRGSAVTPRTASLASTDQTPGAEPWLCGWKQQEGAGTPAATPAPQPPSLRLPVESKTGPAHPLTTTSWAGSPPARRPMPPGDGARGARLKLQPREDRQSCPGPSCPGDAALPAAHSLTWDGHLLQGPRREECGGGLALSGAPAASPPLSNGREAAVRPWAGPSQPEKTCQTPALPAPTQTGRGPETPAPGVRRKAYLTASSLLFCRMSSMNSWILRLNSRQL